jgi:hypothetical protein
MDRAGECRRRPIKFFGRLPQQKKHRGRDRESAGQEGSRDQSRCALRGKAVARFGPIPVVGPKSGPNALS